MARAVHAAHEAKVVHRDLKPANIPLTLDGTPKISDFGLAKHLDAETVRTQSGAIFGTPAYMSPEQASGQSKAIGPAADIHPLGVILYELLARRAPFQGQLLRYCQLGKKTRNYSRTPAISRWRSGHVTAG